MNRKPYLPAEGQRGQAERPGTGPAVPDDHYLPPRKTVHPTEKEKWLPLFYRSLLWIFVLLVVGLLFWGYQRLY
ncbi:hypothetical protein J2T17_001342 [Paenibacillus mucilaginosus]|uniref:hypothetical protein n=1 Tax=Paenibacillus mucilaginosus TaxID=61624 RepID=UPI003D1EF020